MRRLIPLILCLIALPAGAEGIGADTLAGALARAWARHPEAAALPARTAEAAARLALAAALTPEPPAISVGHVNDGLASGRGKREWEAELAAPLWLPGQQAARRAAAAAGRELLPAQAEALRLELAGELRAAWWAVAEARVGLDLAQARLATARALEADVRRRFEVGELARVDANLARSERLGAQGELAQAQAALQGAERAYEALTGAVPPIELSPEAGHDGEPGPGHPRIQALAAAASHARAQLETARRTRRQPPELGLRLSRERGDATEPYINSLGLKLSIPFSSGPALRAASAAAQAEAARAEALVAEAERQLRQQAAAARAGLAAVDARLALARERQALSADNLKLLEKGFALGESDLASLLRARAAEREARAEVERLKVALDGARSRLNQALGLLP